MGDLARLIEAGPFYICDLRPEWSKQWAVTFWRPANAGYAYPLSWSGKYDRETVMERGAYYHQREGGKLTRFPVPCSVADALATEPPRGMIEDDAGPIVRNTKEHRAKLRAAGRAILRALEAEGRG